MNSMPPAGARTATSPAIDTPVRSGNGRELANLAGPQPVRRSDLAHLNLGSGKTAPFQQIDELPAQSRAVA